MFYRGLLISLDKSMLLDVRMIWWQPQDQSCIVSFFFFLFCLRTCSVLPFLKFPDVYLKKFEIFGIEYILVLSKGKLHCCPKNLTGQLRSNLVKLSIRGEKKSLSNT